MPVIRLTVAGILLAAAAAVAAQGVYPPPQNVLQLAATGSVEVQQDLLSLSLTTSREGADASTVQSQLKAALDAALNEARAAARPGQLDVRTGHFGLMPRYARDGKISGWQGTAELLLEGRDFPRITQAAARIQTLTVGAVNFGLSREQRATVESQAQAMAIRWFQAKDAELSRGFGFSGYSLREIAVNSNEQGGPRPRMMAMEAKAAAVDAPLPVEAGKSTVLVTVSGSVQLR